MRDEAKITTTYSVIETAMCIYMVLEDSRLAFGETRSDEHPFKAAELAIPDWCGNFGAFTMRDQAWQLAPRIEEVWRTMSEEERDGGICWDFEFIPEFVLYCLKFDENEENIEFLADTVDGLRDLYRKGRATAAAFPAGPGSTRQRDQFIKDCKEEAERQWAYPDLVTDDCVTRTNYAGSRMQQAFEMGEKPADFVKWLGEKYDLSPAD